MLSVRPKIAELSFQLYGRTLHPELFEIYKTKEFKRGSYTARLDITSAGHLITWRTEHLTLSEVATSAHNPLPQRRKLVSRRLLGTHSEQIEYLGGVKYETTFSLEPSTAELFWAFQQQLNKSDHHEGLVHSFDSSGRMAMGAISYIYAELRDRTFRVQAFHTFPDDCVLVKTQSVIYIPAKIAES